MNRICGNLPVKGAEIYYETAGEGEAVLFIHDDSDSRMWEPHFMEFARHFNSIRFDHRFMNLELPDFVISTIKKGTNSFSQKGASSKFKSTCPEFFQPSL